MSDFMSRASLAGAVDLSGLKKTDTPTTSATSGVANPQPAGSGGSLKVPDLVALGTETNLKSFVNMSASVPVLVDFFAGDLEPSKTLSAKLEMLVRRIAGRMFLLRVDTQAALNVAQAFGVKEVPSVVALIKGQPIPLFEGDQSEETIQTVLDRLLQVAAENSVTGTLEVSVSLPNRPRLNCHRNTRLPSMLSTQETTKKPWFSMKRHCEKIRPTPWLLQV